MSNLKSRQCSYEQIEELIIRSKQEEVIHKATQ